LQFVDYAAETFGVVEASDAIKAMGFDDWVKVVSESKGQGEEGKSPRQVVRVLARNTHIIHAIETLMEGTRAGNYDVDFPRWLQFHR